MVESEHQEDEHAIKDEVRQRKQKFAKLKEKVRAAAHGSEATAQTMKHLKKNAVRISIWVLSLRVRVRVMVWARVRVLIGVMTRLRVKFRTESKH